MTKSILLTGHKGFLGNHLLKALRSENDVYGLDATTYADFTNQLRSIDETFDFLIHCGGVCDSEQEDNLLWQMNYQATCDIAEFCEKNNIKLIFISSCVALNPDTPYGWSKHCAEFYMHHKVAGMNLCILRPYNIWGFDEHTKATPSIVHKIMTQTLPAIYKACVRDFIFVEDVVSAVVRVVKDWTPGVYEVGTGIGTEIETLYIRMGVPKPKIVPCTIRRYSVARKQHLLPGWKASIIDMYLEKIQKAIGNE